MPLSPLLLVAVGGAIGACCRYLVGRLAEAAFGAGHWGTLAVNVAGGFALGVLTGVLTRRGGQAAQPSRLLLAVGVLGGFTTVCAVSLNLAGLADSDGLDIAVMYATVSAVGTVLTLAAGLRVARVLT